MKTKTLLIAGGSGFIGRAATVYFQQKGWNVEWLSRSSSTETQVKTWHWNPASGQMDAAAFDAVDVVLNLAGLSLAHGSWTAERKKAFEDSRLMALNTLSQHLPKERDIFLISASATGYYGSTSDASTAVESALPGSDFLAGLCVNWESAAKNSAFSRVGIARIGVVLDATDGAYPLMVLPIRWGLGAVPGTGRQGLSWIHIGDVVRGFEWMIEQQLQGVYNFTAPKPVSMRRFMAEAARKYRRRLWPISVPESLLYLVLGEKSLLACQGVYAIPQALLDSGFSFLYPSIGEAIEEF
jgi:uncharacterized protein